MHAGALNLKVTTAALRTTICQSGYTSALRPPASITGAEKAANAESYGSSGALRDAEYDHLLSGVVTRHEEVCAGGAVSGMPSRFGCSAGLRSEQTPGPAELATN